MKKPLIIVDPTASSTAWIEREYGPALYLEEVTETTPGPLVVTGIMNGAGLEKLQGRTDLILISQWENP